MLISNFTKIKRADSFYFYVHYKIIKYVIEISVNQTHELFKIVCMNHIYSTSIHLTGYDICIIICSDEMEIPYHHAMSHAPD
jgi:hypothetical protein